MSPDPTAHESTPGTARESLTLAAGAVLGLAFADVGLSMAASRTMALDSAPFLVSAVCVLLGTVLAGTYVALRGAVAVGLPAGVETQRFLLLAIPLWVYELLRWRMAGSPGVGLLLIVFLTVALPAALQRSHARGVVGLCLALPLLAGTWAAIALSDPGGNPMDRVLYANRTITLTTVTVVALQVVWVALCALVWRRTVASMPGGRFRGVVWGVLIIVSGGAWLAASHLWLHPPSQEEVRASGAPAMEPMAGLGRPNIVLIVLDSVRADRTDLADASLENTPALYALGKSGAIFTRAYANSTWSLPSHASLFTGLHPHNHGAVNRIVDTIPAADGQTEDTLLVIEPVPLADEHLTLAEFLLSRGYRTALMAANHGFFSEVFGLLQGFMFQP